MKETVPVLLVFAQEVPADKAFQQIEEVFFIRVPNLQQQVKGKWPADDCRVGKDRPLLVGKVADRNAGPGGDVGRALAVRVQRPDGMGL